MSTSAGTIWYPLMDLQDMLEGTVLCALWGILCVNVPLCHLVVVPSHLLFNGDFLLDTCHCPEFALSCTLVTTELTAAEIQNNVKIRHILPEYTIISLHLLCPNVVLQCATERIMPPMKAPSSCPRRPESAALVAPDWCLYMALALWPLSMSMSTHDRARAHTHKHEHA